MASDLFVMTRPFYMAAADVDFSVDISGAPVACSATVGTYPSIPCLTWKIEERLIALVHASFTVTYNTEFKIVIARTGNFQFTAIDARLRKILGFAATNQMFIGGAATYTADYTPLYTWFPERVRFDRDRFAHVSTWKGKRMITGALSGATGGDVLYQLQAEIEDEPRYNLYRSAGRTTFEKDRSLDVFVWGYGDEVDAGCCDGWPSIQSEPALDNFYFWPDYSDLANLSTMTLGSAEDFDLTAAPSTYAWCQFESKWIEAIARRRHSAPIKRDLYGTDLPFHSVSELPAWTAP